MKRNSLFAGRFALTGVAAAAMMLSAADVWALGLGRLAVQSSLGETLRAEIDVSSMSSEEEATLQVKVASPDAYRAAGVDYNSVLPSARVALMRRADGRSFLRVTSDRAVQEPFVDVILELSWSSGRLVREYTLLLDPPTTRAATPATSSSQTPSVSPSFSGASPEPESARRARRTQTPKPTSGDAASTESRRNAPSVATNDAGVDEYKVRAGDTLYRIAGKTQRAGVSLDQMLASLYQANPDAFAKNNMNRLKSGVVLTVPSADAAKALSPAEAKQMIQAQSVDFGAYRQRMAGAVPSVPTEGAPRQASGKVQASVEDRKQAPGAAPDKLTLSKGAAAKASAPEASISKEREKKDAAARLAELSKNVEELKKLSGTGGAASKPVPGIKVPVVAPTVAPTPVIASAPTSVSAPVAAVQPAPVLVPAPAASAPVVMPVPAAASVASVGASMPLTVASAPQEVASVPAQAASMVSPAPASRPVVVPVPPIAVEESSISALIEDNPLALAAGGGLLALLLGFGVYRFTKRGKKDSGETSFLESRLQPDSFFGASGGQRIDTRDASGASSSMSYSLSQLDAIGDVDPVAEADVYLAYGRDLQAEEILKEAMRASPERLAIRTKLLEVYAKRRDTKGFELLATQLYGLTGGNGEDWQKAQQIGLTIDPENSLYQPGGAPASADGEARPSLDMLGASTMPQSVLPSPPEFGSSVGPSSGFDAASASSSPNSTFDLDLDLDQLDSLPPSASMLGADATQPLNVPPAAADPMSFDLPTASSSTQAPVAGGAMEFDLSSISLDLGDSPAAQPAIAQGGGANLAEIDLGEVVDDNTDPVSRKLELAEEFRQIGDMEGARDLLQEVVAKSTGAVQGRAKKMLDELG